MRMKKEPVLKWMWLAILVFFISCEENLPDKLSKTELVKYISDKKHGLAQEQEVNGIKVRLSYQPSSMLVVQELQEEQKRDTVLIKELENKYRDRYYFLLKFSRNGKEAIRQLGGFSRYSDMVQVLSFQMNRFINLTTAQKDTVELGDYLFDQTYGMSDGNTLLMSFKKKKIEHSSAVEINIGECGFGTGALKFTIERKDIDKVPGLDYSNWQ